MGRAATRKEVAGLIVYFCVLFVPLFGVTGHGVRWENIVLGTRRIGLLANSIKLGAMAAALSLVIGFFAAVRIANSRLSDKWYRYFFLLFLAIPYYIYALSWMILIRFLSGIWPSLMKYSLQGFGACLFVEVMTYIPLACLFCLIAVEMLDAKGIEMAGIYRKPVSILFGQILPQASPVIAAGAGCIFLLSVTDFSVPSMFQYNTYTLEIYSVYSRTGSALGAWLMAVPVMVILLIPLSFLQKGIRKIASVQKGRSWRLNGCPPGMTGVMNLCFIIVLLQFAVPLVIFIAQSGGAGTLFRSFMMIREQLWLSLIVAFIAAAFALILMTLPSAFLTKTDNPVWYMAALLPMAVPGALQAMGLLEAVNRSPAYGMAKTAFLPGLGCAIRYLPFGLLFLTAARKRIDKGKLEMAYVLCPTKRAYKKIETALLVPGYLCAAGLVFFLSLGEEGIELVLMPPGMETASVKIYNYLHYGASEYVAGFCLIIAAFIILAEIAAAVIIRRYVRGGSGTARKKG